MIRIHFSSWPLLPQTFKDVSVNRVFLSLSTLLLLSDGVSGCARLASHEFVRVQGGCDPIHCLLQ